MKTASQMALLVSVIPTKKQNKTKQLEILLQERVKGEGQTVKHSCDLEED